MGTENHTTHKTGFWKDHSSAWKLSGLTQQAYCEQAGIGYRHFVYQHSRILKQTKRHTSKFIESKPESVNSNNQSAALQLLLPNGVRIGIGHEVNPSLLQTVLTIAGSLPC